MRARGTGTIQRQSDGSFLPRLPGQNGAWLPRCETEEEAAILLAHALSATLSEPGGGGLTLAKYGVKVFERRQKEGQRSAKDSLSVWRSHVSRSWIGEILLSCVRRADVVTWCDELAMRKAQPAGKRDADGPRQKTRPRLIARSTSQNALNALRVVLTDAVERGLLEESPAATVRLPSSIRKRRKTHETWTYLSLEEQAALFASAEIPERERLAIQFAIATGVREDELWSIKLVDVDKRRGEFTVRKTKGGKFRTLPLLPLARQALDRWLPMLRVQQNESGLLWPSETGCRRHGPPKRWTEWMASLDLVGASRSDGKDIRFHDLRHTCATALLCGWWGRRWSLEEVQKMLGHASKTTTERYAHLAANVLRDAAAGTISLPISLPRGAQNVKNIESHLCESNARPTVYETFSNPLEEQEVSLTFSENIARSIQDLAGEVLEDAAANAPLFASRSVRLAELVKVAFGPVQRRVSSPVRQQKRRRA